MDTKKLFATFAILMLALGVAGFAYAHWEKLVTVDGEVTTGKLNLIIVSAADDDEPLKPDPGKDKNVADTEIIVDPKDPQKAIVKITNAYPCYYVYWHMTIKNIGTIPAKLKEIIIDNPNPCLEVRAWDRQYEQLHPNEEGDYSGYVHVKQCAEQGATYTFTVKFVFWNWNELPKP